MSLTFINIPADMPVPATVQRLVSALPGSQIVQEATAGVATGRPLICLVDPPIRDIARRLSAGDTAVRAASGWTEMIEGQLGVLRSHRRHVTFVRRRDISLYPGPVMSAIIRRLGKTSPLSEGDLPVWTEVGDSAAIAAPDDPILQLVATCLLQENPRMTGLSQEVEAMMLAPIDGKADELKASDRAQMVLDQRNDLIRTLGSAEKRIEDLLDSTSWRVTTPLRSIRLATMSRTGRAG